MTCSDVWHWMPSIVFPTPEDEEGGVPREKSTTIPTTRAARSTSPRTEIPTGRSQSGCRRRPTLGRGRDGLGRGWTRWRFLLIGTFQSCTARPDAGEEEP